MVWFRTQREVSEYFGKNPNDRSFISRKIAKGAIERKDWWYEIVALGSSGDSNLEVELERYKKGYDKSVEDYNKLLEKYNWLKSEYDEWLNKWEKSESTGGDDSSVDWNTYNKALKRLEAKDNYIYWLQMQIKKLVDPKWEQDEWDIISALNTDWWYDPHDENYL